LTSVSCSFLRSLYFSVSLVTKDFFSLISFWNLSSFFLALSLILLSSAFSNLSYMPYKLFSSVLYLVSQVTLFSDNFYSFFFFYSSSFLFSEASSSLSSFSILLSVSTVSTFPPLLSLLISSIVYLVAYLTTLVSSNVFLAFCNYSVFFLSMSLVFSILSEFSFYSAFSWAFFSSYLSESGFSSAFLSESGFTSSLFSVGLDSSSLSESFGFFSSFYFDFSDFSCFSDFSDCSDFSGFSFLASLDLLFCFSKRLSPFLIWSSILVIFAFSFFNTFFNSFLARPFYPLISDSNSLTLPSCFFTALLASTRFCSIYFIGSVILLDFLDDFYESYLT